MTKINKHNYEVFLIDYLDGKLSSEEVTQVMLFLEQHPEIKFEYTPQRLQVESFSLPDSFKANLKKYQQQDAWHHVAFDELYIAQLEGDCTKEESAVLDEMARQNPSLHRVQKLVVLTQLEPNLSVVFPFKNTLKQNRFKVIPLFVSFAVAALILILLSLPFFIRQVPNVNTTSPKDLVTNTESKQNTPSSNQEILSKEPQILNSQPAYAASQRNVPIFKKKLQSQINADTEHNTHADLLIIPPITTKSLALMNSTFDELTIAQNNNTTFEPHIVLNSPEDKDSFLPLNLWLKKVLIEHSHKNLEDINKKPNEQFNIEPANIVSVGAGLLENATGTKLNMSRLYNDKGELKSFTFATRNFKFERILGR